MPKQNSPISESFHADDTFSNGLVVVFVNEGKVFPLEELTPFEADRGIVLPESLRDYFVQQFKDLRIWGILLPENERET
jgi:hypothetical protein